DAARLNHSATHLLHAALRRRLSEHVKQAGSLVTPERLRFDFSHHRPVDDGALRDIEDETNASIRANAEVTTEEMSYDDAIKAGALAFFGDKYGDRVSVVRMGGFSTELCGGTHVQRTGDIGVLKIRGESGVAAGVRRLEAVSGEGALELIRSHEAVLRDISALLRTPGEEAAARLEKLLAQQRELEKRIAELQGKLAGGASRDLLADARRRLRAARRREPLVPLAETAAAPAELRFADARLFRELLGQHDEHVKGLERQVGVRIDIADSTLTLHGDPLETELVSRVLLQLYGLLESGYPIYASDVDYALRILSSDRNAKLRDIFLDTVFISAHKRVITP